MRRKLPFVAVLGNDALLERREPDPAARVRREPHARLRADCPRATTWWWRRSAATARYVERAADLPGAIERALASGKPACINVMIESIAAPVIRASS